MSLYDGLGLEKDKGIHDTKSDVLGWSSGIKLLQSQLQLKKAALTQANKQKDKRQGIVLAPVVDLKGRNTNDDNELSPYNSNRENKIPNSHMGGDPIWNIEDEYDPVWPNDYEKIMKERKEKKEKEREEERRREMDERERRRRERYERHRDDEFEPEQRRRNYERPDRRLKRREEEEEDFDRSRRPLGAGAAIAPPPSLLHDNNTEITGELLIPTRALGSILAPGLGGSVAAKIMARYGFKEGQGLGKQEQGMSTALQVEKTSKRGGKIIHERDMPKSTPKDQQDSITETMKNPSKVVLLKNMVGPGEVDDELEPETKEECSKYGEVSKVIIFEIPDGFEEEAVRIFIEFKRIESAIKAVVDINGRYFGGRIVKASFYNVDKFRRLELAE